MVSSDPAITDQVVTGVRNPLPAEGGLAPESIEQARLNAPSAFRTQERAVTPDDYAAAMARPKTGNDATKNLKPDDETQITPEGTKIGLLRKSEVMADFKKLAKPRRPK